MAKQVNTNEVKELLNNGGIVVVDFFATWCGPCQMFLPIYEEVASEIEGATLVKLDIDQDTEFAGENGVMGVPTIIAYKDGVEVSRFSGFRPKEELLSFINGIK